MDGFCKGSGLARLTGTLFDARRRFNDSGFGPYTRRLPPGGDGHHGVGMTLISRRPIGEALSSNKFNASSFVERESHGVNPVEMEPDEFGESRFRAVVGVSLR